MDGSRRGDYKFSLFYSQRLVYIRNKRGRRGGREKGEKRFQSVETKTTSEKGPKTDRVRRGKREWEKHGG